MYNDIFRPKRDFSKALPWLIKGAGSKYSFRAITTNFGNNLMYPYAKQKGNENVEVKVSSYGLGFDNFYSNNELTMGTYNLFTETMTLISSEDALHGLEIYRRECKMQSETDGLKIFR